MRNTLKALGIALTKSEIIKCTHLGTYIHNKLKNQQAYTHAYTLNNNILSSVSFL